MFCQQLPVWKFLERAGVKKFYLERLKSGNQVLDWGSENEDFVRTNQILRQRPLDGARTPSLFVQPS